MAVAVQCSLCLSVFYRQIKSAWWSREIALAVACWVRGRKAETALKTLDASAIWKQPRNALQQNLIFRSCHSQEESEHDCHHSHPCRSANVMLDLWEQKGWVDLGHLRGSQASCWSCGLSDSPLVLAETPQGTPSMPSWSHMGLSYWLQSWGCGRFHLTAFASELPVEVIRC